MDSERQKIEIIKEGESETLAKMLKFTAKEHDKFTYASIGGKTGTPEREWYDTRGVGRIINDGWFICFIDEAKIKSADGVNNHPVAIAVRIERIYDGMSGKAVALTKNVVLDILREQGYMN